MIATIVAMAVSYAGNRYWTFRHRQRTGVRREGVLFLLLNGVGLVIQLACLGFTTYLLGLHGQAVLQRRPDHRHRAGHAVPLLVLQDVGVAGSARGRPGPRAAQGTARPRESALSSELRRWSPGAAREAALPAALADDGTV